MMNCPNCGHLNDKEASFCEKCGVNLKASHTGMLTSTKILIAVVIVLIAVLGLLGGMLLPGFFMNNNTSEVNQTNASVNSTNNTDTTQSSSESNNQQSELLTMGQAIDLARSNVEIHDPYRVETVLNPSLGPGDPAHWSVFFINDKTGKTIVVVSLDANTGAIRKINYY